MLLLALALLAQDRPLLPAPDDDGARTASPQQPDEVIVNGTRDMSRFRAGPIDGARWAEKPIRPRVNLPGGARGAVYAEQRSLPGASAPAAMVRLQIPFGRKPARKK